MMFKLYKRFIYKIIDVNDKLNSKIKIFIYNLHPDIKIGKNVYIGTGVKISCEWGGKITISQNVRILKGVVLLTYGNDIFIGDGCIINPYCIIYGQGGTKIGTDVLIAGHSMIVSQNHNFIDDKINIKNAGSSEKGIIIEENVWIGHGCSILDGVVIKKGTVVAAGCVLNKNTSEYSVYGGVPAKFIKKYV